MRYGDLRPGQWIPIDQIAIRGWLRSLAQRQLGDYQHLADDVVSRAVIKWRHIPAYKVGVARIERVIASEAKSVVRSELRARNRDTRVYRDPVLAAGGKAVLGSAEDLSIVRLALADLIDERPGELDDFDIEVFELLIAGATIADVVRATGVPRHRIRRSVGRLRSQLTALDMGPRSARYGSPDRQVLSRRISA